MNCGPIVQTGAIAIFLIPIAVVLMFLRGSTRWRPLSSHVLLWVPAAIAADLMLWFCLSRLVAFEAAVMVSRVVWLGIAVAAWHRYRESPVWLRPRLRDLLFCVAVALAAFSFSTLISRPYSLWDRQFHVPVVTALRGQRNPFLTALQPRTVLHYHFAGDAIAAALQVFSANRIHASLALAMAHDLCFGLVGLCLSAWLVSRCGRHLWIALAPFAVLFSGPFALQRVGVGSPVAGYSYLSLLTISFRPHVSLACLLLCGAVGALTILFSRLEEEDHPTILGLVLIVAALGLTDEASAALFLITLGGCWLVFPRILGSTRMRGVLVLGIAVAAVLIPNILFQGALAPGGPVQKIRLVAWRVPGFTGPSVPVFGPTGIKAIVTDLGPFFLILAGAVGLAIRHRSRQSIGVMVSLAVTLGVATTLLLFVDVNGQPIENHRFMTICLILFPVAALYCLTYMPSGRWERVPIVGALFLSTVSTFYWYQNETSPPMEYFTNDVDCRSSAGAQLLEKPRPTYVVRKRFFEFAGCRPVFAPGSMNEWGTLLTGDPIGGREAFQSLSSQFVKETESLRAVCPRVSGESDPACRYATTHGLCVPAGTEFRSCELSGEDRRRILAAWMLAR